LKTLYPPQEVHVGRLVAGLEANQAVIDSSETGVGKTICAIHTAARMGEHNHILVVCPKAVIPQWEREIKEAGITHAAVVNWEKLRAGNTVWGKWEGQTFVYDPGLDIIIFDEAQKAKAPDSKNAMMVRDAVENGHTKVMLLSATLANSPLEMRAAFHVLGLCKWKGFYGYIRRFLHCTKNMWGALEFTGGDEDLDMMREAIYGRGKGSRITREELRGFFGDNEVVKEPIDFGDDGEIQKLYDAMEAELLELEQSSADDKPSPLTVQLRARQSAELLKVPYMVEAVRDLVDEGQHVAVFVNFRATLETLREKLGTTCAIYGGQTPSERQECIDKFQSGAEKIIVVMISAGGVGLSLHDTVGGQPRTTLISPSWDEKETIQALGRCYRAGGKTPVLQKILIASGTVEEKVAQALGKKTARVEKLNDAKDFLNEPEQAVSKGITTTMIPDQQKLEHAERSHSKHSPSSLATKLACPGFQNDQTRDKSAADRGSLGHEMVEKANFDMAPEDAELTRAAVKCYQFLKTLQSSRTIHHQEIKVAMLDGQSGHIDHLFLQPDGSADLVDLKFSFSSTYKADSPQFWAYCLGVWNTFPEVNDIRVWVLLPFIDEVDTEEFNKDEHYDLFYASGKKIIEMAEASDPATFRVGRHCNWCARLKNCRKWAEFGVELANRYLGEGDKYKLPETSVHGSEITDPETLTVLWRIAPVLKAATEGWRKAALESRLEGNDLPGLELFERRGTREITDAPGAYEAVKDVLTAEELLSAADLKVGALEKLWQSKQPRGSKKASLDELMMRLTEASAISSGAPTLMLKESK
jgi:superfamily II DNA or RNA helicase